MNLYEASSSAPKENTQAQRSSGLKNLSEASITTKPKAGPQKRKLLSSFPLPNLNITPEDNETRARPQVRKKVQKRNKGKNVLKYGMSDEDEDELKVKKLQDLVFSTNNKSATDSTQSSPPI